MIEVESHPFVLPGVYPGPVNDIYTQLRRELTSKYVTKNNMNESEAKIAALKFLESLLEIQFLKDIFEASCADTHNSISIENKGTSDDKNVVLSIDGICFVSGIEYNAPNVEREKNLIKIKIIRPGDKIHLQVWTDETFSRMAESRSKRFGASSDAGVIAVSVH
jgi:hypothetical protein